MPIKAECRGCQYATALGTCEAYGPCVRDGIHAAGPKQPMSAEAIKYASDTPYLASKTRQSLEKWGMAQPPDKKGKGRSKAKPKPQPKRKPVLKSKSSQVPLLTLLQNREVLSNEERNHRDRMRLWQSYSESLQSEVGSRLTWSQFLESQGRADLIAGHVKRPNH